VAVAILQRVVRRHDVVAASVPLLIVKRFEPQHLSKSVYELLQALVLCAASHSSFYSQTPHIMYGARLLKVLQQVSCWV
jgi:hypothetical protein